MHGDNPTRLPEFAAVILDLDGLVIDSEPTYKAAWKEAGRILGYQLGNALLASFTGKSYDLIEHSLKAEFGTDFPLETFREKSAEVWHESVDRTGIPVKPGLHALLEDLDRYAIPFCLATNSEQVYAEKCLNYAGLDDAFPIRITRDQVKAPKPAPDIFLAAAERLDVDPEHCLALEDSETGAKAALDAETVVMLVAEAAQIQQALRSQVFAVFDNLEEFRLLLKSSLLE